MKALILAGALVLASSSAWATIALSYQIDGAGAVTTCATSAGNALADCGSFTAGGIFDIASLATNSNSPGTPTLADLFSATTSLQNTSGATHFIDFFIYADGFTLPTSGTLVSSIGGSVVTGTAANALSFRSCVSTTAGAACPGTGGQISAGPGTPSITAFGSYSDTKTTAIVAALGTPYTMSETLRITLGAGGKMNFSGSTFVSAVPEPMTLSMMGIGLLGLGLFGRKRMVKR